MEQFKPTPPRQPGPDQAERTRLVLVGLGGLALSCLLGAIQGFPGVIFFAGLYLLGTATWHAVVGHSWMGAAVPFQISYRAAVVTAVASFTAVGASVSLSPRPGDLTAAVHIEPRAGTSAETRLTVPSATPVAPSASPTPTSTATPSVPGQPITPAKPTPTPSVTRSAAPSPAPAEPSDRQSETPQTRQPASRSTGGDQPSAHPRTERPSQTRPSRMRPDPTVDPEQPTAEVTRPGRPAQPSRTPSQQATASAQPSARPSERPAERPTSTTRPTTAPSATATATAPSTTRPTTSTPTAAPSSSVTIGIDRFTPNFPCYLEGARAPSRSGYRMVCRLGRHGELVWRPE